jgi:hypothetical protein
MVETHKAAMRRGSFMPRDAVLGRRMLVVGHLARSCVWTNGGTNAERKRASAVTKDRNRDPLYQIGADGATICRTV